MSDELKQGLLNLVANNPLVIYQQKQIDFMQKVNYELKRLHDVNWNHSGIKIEVLETQILLGAINEYKAMIEEERNA